jgi:lactate dehydrogenase-like 2-hydroxyacid dehydrogenase
VVCNIAVGYNNFDLPAMTARGVLGTNTPGVLDAATADFTWALILATARRLTEAEAWLRAGKWHGWKLKQFLGMDVQGATLGIIGMGRIGQAVAKRARGFDMPVLYYNRTRLAPELERACSARRAMLDELLAQSDIVTLHTPYSAESHHLIGAAQLARMKKSAILIHAARGGVVDDAALIAALNSGTIAAAGLDVYENEPKFNPEFLKLRNIVLAPHMASATTNTRRNMAMLAAKNLVAALTGERPPNPLNAEALK